MEIRKVTTEEELFQVGRLRYDITVKEKRLSMVHADHKSQTVIEPLDHCGHVFAAWDQGKVVGTIRTNYLRKSDIGYYYDSYGIKDLSSNICEYTASITTRLAIAKEYRQTNLTLKIGSAAIQDSLENDITHDIVDCRILLVPMFKRLGYLVHRNHLKHPEFGDVSVMVLSLRDDSYLKSIRSPLYRILKSKTDSQFVNA